MNRRSISADHSQHGHEDAACIDRRAELRLQDSQTSAVLFEIMDEIEDVAGRVHESVQLHHDDLAARTNSRIDSSSSRPARLSLLTFRQGRSRSRRPRASANEVHCHTILICESLNSSGFVGSQTPLDDCGSDTGSFQHPHRLGHQWATVLRITRPPFNSGSNVGAASKAICGDSSRSAPQKSRRCSSAPALARSDPARPSGRAGSGRTLRCPSLLGEKSFRGSPPSRAPFRARPFPALDLAVADGAWRIPPPGACCANWSPQFSRTLCLC